MCYALCLIRCFLGTSTCIGATCKIGIRGRVHGRVSAGVGVRTRGVIGVGAGVGARGANGVRTRGAIGFGVLHELNHIVIDIAQQG